MYIKIFITLWKNQHNMIVCSCVLGSIMSLIMSLSFIRCISLKMFQHWKHHSYNVLYDHPVFKQRNVHNTCFKNTVLWITFRIEQRAVGPQQPAWRSRHGNPYWSPGICLSFLSTYHWGKHLVFIIMLPPMLEKSHLQCKLRQLWTTQPWTTGFIFSVGSRTLHHL